MRRAAATLVLSAPLLVPKRFVIVPKQLVAYGDVFRESHGDSSDHLPGHLVLKGSSSLSLKRISTRTVDNFHEMCLPPQVQRVLAEMEVTVPSPIQQQAMGPCMARETTLLVAPHGEGKTVAFLAPLFANLLKDRDVYRISLRERRPRAILMAPTRETIDQLQHVCQKFSKHTGLSCAGVTSQKRAAYHVNRLLKSSPIDVLIMHPRVVLKLIRARRLFVDDVRYAVVDEADAMLSSQQDHEAVHLLAKLQLRNLYKHLWPVKTQFVFSSAFLTRKLEYLLARRFPSVVACLQSKTMHRISATVRQRFYPVKSDAYKMDLLLHLLKKHGHQPTLQPTGSSESESRRKVVPDNLAPSEAVVVRRRNHHGGGDETEAVKSSALSSDELRFVRERALPTAWAHLTTRAAPFTCHVPLSATDYRGQRVMIFFRNIDSATAIYRRLRAAGFGAALLHGALPWATRRANFEQFASGACSILCTTDIASRGLDLHVDMVVNFSVPHSASQYLARCGRVGRMGRRGEAFSLYTKHDAVMVKALETLSKHDIPLNDVSNWNVHMTKPRYQDFRGQRMNAISKSYVSMITKKVIPAHLEKTYLRHNATWRPIYHPKTVHIHGGVSPRQQQRIMERVTAQAVEFRRSQLARRKGGRAKFGHHRYGVWLSKSGAYSGSVANLEQSSAPSGEDFGPPSGPPR